MEDLRTDIDEEMEQDRNEREDRMMESFEAAARLMIEEEVAKKDQRLVALENLEQYTQDAATCLLQPLLRSDIQDVIAYCRDLEYEAEFNKGWAELIFRKFQEAAPEAAKRMFKG